jgi:hypothetical protein
MTGIGQHAQQVSSNERPLWVDLSGSIEGSGVTAVSALGALPDDRCTRRCNSRPLERRGGPGRPTHFFLRNTRRRSLGLAGC